MKVLVATSALQGRRFTDEFDCAEGEFVWMVPICAVGRQNPSGCSCGRRFGGLATGGSTTTASVVELPGLTRRILARTFWAAHGSDCTCPVSELDIDNLLATARRWPEGGVLERQGRRLRLRGFLPTLEPTSGRS